MKLLHKRVMGVVAITLAVSAVVPVAANASGFRTLSVPSMPVVRTTSPRPHNQLVHKVLTYAQRVQAYRNAVKAIDAAFARKIAVAKVTFRKALRGAHTSADQVSARAKFRLTIADAISSRETELGDLGDPPGQTLAPVVDQSNAQLTGM